MEIRQAPPATTRRDEAPVDTMYLTAAREPPEVLQRQRDGLLAAPLAETLEDMPMIMLATNDKRQIIWMNAKARDAIKVRDFMGMRPGEALGCAHAREMPGGCGTSASCAFCGAPAAIMKAVAGATDLEECTISREGDRGGDSMELLVWSKPLDLGPDRVVLLAAHDMSAQKRHEVLERVFYHDIGNTVGGIRSILELVDGAPDEPGALGLDQYLGLLRSAADQLIDEIDSQRALKAAEEGNLTIEKTRVSVRAVIERAVALFEYPLFGKDIRIELREPARADAELLTDPVLLRRVIVNMLKNALEASNRGETIRIGFDDDQSGVVIWTWNAAIMSQETRMRMFQRSYSTKGRGRGLGTYGMRLLTERYLGGSVTFESGQESGTTFRVRIPKKHATTP